MPHPPSPPLAAVPARRVRIPAPHAAPYAWKVMSTAESQPRTYEVKTYGCQMNVHDSERLTGLLEDAGYVATPAGEQADVVVLQHLRRTRERRQQALRQPQPPRAR